ncbi:MAG: hypothetical protein ACKOF9_06240 [Burkholderiales bacterium]
MKPLLQLARVCVRRSPWVFSAITLFFWALWTWWLGTAPQNSERASWLGHGLFFLLLLSLVVALVAYTFLCETLVAFKRQAQLPLLPRFASTLHQFLWLTLFLALLFWGVPMVWMLGVSSMLSVLFTFVAFICLGLSLGLVRLSTGSIGAGRTAFQIVVFLPALAPLAGQGWKTQLTTWVTQHPTAAWVGSLGLATVALPIWIWTVRRVVVLLMQPPAGIDEVRSAVSPWSRVKTWWEPHLPGSREPVSLLAPGPAAPLTVLGFTVFYSGFFYFIMGASQFKNLDTLAIFPLMVALPFVVQGLWISPRLLLLPGGFGRQSISWRICEQVVRTHLPALVLMMAAPTLALTWAWGLPWSHGLLLVLSSVTSLLLLLALALLVRVVPVTAKHHQACMTIAFLVTVAVGSFQSHYAIAALQSPNAYPWFLALLPVVLGLLPTLAVLVAIEKPWANYDWRNMPRSPTQRTMFSWKESGR